MHLCNPIQYQGEIVGTCGPLPPENLKIPPSLNVKYQSYVSQSKNIHCRFLKIFFLKILVFLKKSLGVAVYGVVGNIYKNPFVLVRDSVPDLTKIDNWWQLGEPLWVASTNGEWHCRTHNPNDINLDIPI